MTEYDQRSLVLYHSGTSVCSQKVRLTLAELNLDWTGHMLDLAKGEQFDPEYLKLNPHAVVPTLLADDQTIIESNEIMRFLCASRSGTSPQGSNLYHPAVEIWLERSLDLHKAINTFTYVIVNRKRLAAMSPAELEERLSVMPDQEKAAKFKSIVADGFDSEVVSDARQILRENLPHINSAASSTEWLAGDRFSLADAAIIPFLHRLGMLGLSIYWQDKPAISNWMARFAARPSFSIAIDAFITPPVKQKYREAITVAGTALTDKLGPYAPYRLTS
ncbi:MAG: glutathione S-transferase family protein [Pseudomonadota bacterium]